MAKKFEIRNSTAEFLTFVAEGKEQGVQVLYKDETVWATQKAMAQLFDCSTDNIGLHLKYIYDTNELNKETTTEKISVVQQEGAREVTVPSVVKPKARVEPQMKVIARCFAKPIIEQKEIDNRRRLPRFSLSR